MSFSVKYRLLEEHHISQILKEAKKLFADGIPVTMFGVADIYKKYKRQGYSIKAPYGLGFNYSV